MAKAPPSPPPVARFALNVEFVMAEAVPALTIEVKIAPPAGKPDVTAELLFVKVVLATMRLPVEH